MWNVLFRNSPTVSKALAPVASQGEPDCRWKSGGIEVGFVKVGSDDKLCVSKLALPAALANAE